MFQIGDIVTVVGDEFLEGGAEWEICGVPGDPFYDSRGYIHPQLGVLVTEVGGIPDTGIWVFKDKCRLITAKEPSWEL